MKFDIIFVCVLLVFNYVKLKADATNQFILFTQIENELLYAINETWTLPFEYENLSSTLTCELVKTLPRFIYNATSTVTLKFYYSLLHGNSSEKTEAESSGSGVSNRQLQVDDNITVIKILSPAKYYTRGGYLLIASIVCHWNNFVVFLARNKKFLNFESYFVFLQTNNEYPEELPEPIAVVMKFRPVIPSAEGISFYKNFTRKKFSKKAIEFHLQMNPLYRLLAEGTQVQLQKEIENAYKCILFLQLYTNIIHEQAHISLVIKFALKCYKKEPDSTWWCMMKNENAAALVKECTFEIAHNEGVTYDLIEHPTQEDTYYLFHPTSPRINDIIKYNNVEVAAYLLAPPES